MILPSFDSGTDHHTSSQDGSFLVTPDLDGILPLVSFQLLEYAATAARHSRIITHLQISRHTPLRLYLAETCHMITVKLSWKL